MGDWDAHAIQNEQLDLGAFGQSYDIAKIGSQALS